MVVFYLRNSRIPQGKIVPVTISLELDAVVDSYGQTREDQAPGGSGNDFPNLQDQEGDRVWILTLSTTEKDGSGNLIPTEIINLVSLNNVHLELEAALGRMGQKIDWGTPLEDTQAPKLISITPPLNQTSNVPLNSNIIIRLQDPFPAAGIDLSTIQMKINGLPVITNGVAEPLMNVEYRGNVFDLTIIHRPKVITT